MKTAEQSRKESLGARINRNNSFLEKIEKEIDLAAASGKLEIIYYGYFDSKTIKALESLGYKCEEVATDHNKYGLLIKW